MRSHETTVKVRFNEIDAYRVAWHGHYIAWMEIGRNELAQRFGLDAETLQSLGYLAPVVRLEVDYLRPARYAQELRVRTTLQRTETASLEFHTVILDPDGKSCLRAKTVHVLTDADGVLQFRLPPEVAPRVAALLEWVGGT
ncbi:MAG TPA: acyl-CoA thioesterase [Verrucomicrobiae bacterium]|nr:acyl-CoA thioesterase [Verrucomicrobiae bacterium]